MRRKSTVAKAILGEIRYYIGPSCNVSVLSFWQTLSSLQSTLLSSTDLPSHLQQSLVKATSQALSHAQWLHGQHSTSTPATAIQPSISTVTVPSMSSKCTESTKSKLNTKTTSNIPVTKSYDAELSSYVGLNLVETSKNPYRSNLYKTPSLRGASDPKQYSKHTTTSTFGRYTVTRKNYNCFDPTAKAKHVPPSKEFISRVLGQVTRRLMVSYDTKIIEVGATLKVYCG